MPSYRPVSLRPMVVPTLHANFIDPWYYQHVPLNKEQHCAAAIIKMDTQHEIVVAELNPTLVGLSSAILGSHVVMCANSEYEPLS
jgi:hypothetical protein